MLKSILLVEDNPKDLDLTLYALEKSKLANQVDVVRDGEEALDYLLRKGVYKNRSSHNPAVILLDIKLPKLTGIEGLQTVRATSHLENVPVVMLTSSKEEEDLLQSYNLGVNAYVIKPIDLKAFTIAIAQLGIFWAVINEPPVGSVRYAP